jgi:hypothetical protein
MTVSFLNISRTQGSTVIAHLLTRFVLLTTASSVILSQTVEPPTWRPTESAPRAEDYAGTEACKSCHTYQWSRQRKSQMGRSMIRPNQPSRDHPQLRFQRGPYTYTIRLGRQGGPLILQGLKTPDPRIVRLFLFILRPDTWLLWFHSSFPGPA